MSNEEQAAAIGRAVQEYGEVKQRLAALKIEADRHSDTLHNWGRYVSAGVVGGPNLFKGDAPADYIDIPAQRQLAQLVEDVTAALARRRELAAQLKDAGVDPKD